MVLLVKRVQLDVLRVLVIARSFCSGPRIVAGWPFLFMPPTVRARNAVCHVTEFAAVALSICRQ